MADICSRCSREYTRTAAQTKARSRLCYPCKCAKGAAKKRAEVAARGNKRTKHGMCQTPIYKVWRSMVDRCHLPTHQAYKDYGGRGIAVCARWRDFKSFFEDMGHAPDGMQLDRRDNDGPYEPSNCRWATRTEQAQNRRSTVFITYQGVTKCISEWAREAGLKTKTVFSRIHNGWPTEKLFAPTLSRQQCRAGRSLIQSSNT